MTATTYRGRGYNIDGGLRFRAADDSGIEHIWNGGDEYPEALAKWKAGYRYYDASSGRFLQTPLQRSRPSRLSRPAHPGPRDYLKEMDLL